MRRFIESTVLGNKLHLTSNGNTTCEIPTCPGETQHIFLSKYQAEHRKPWKKNKEQHGGESVGTQIVFITAVKPQQAQAKSLQAHCPWGPWSSTNIAEKFPWSLRKDDRLPVPIQVVTAHILLFPNFPCLISTLLLTRLLITRQYTSSYSIWHVSSDVMWAVLMTSAEFH